MPVQTPLIDDFVSGLGEANKELKPQKSRIFWSPTAGCIGLAALMSYIAGLLINVAKTAKAGLNKAEKNKLFKNVVIKLGFATLGYYALVLGVQKLLRLNTDKNYEKVKKDFDEINLNKNTNAFISDELFNSKFLAGLYKIKNGEVVISKDSVDDPILRKKVKKLFKHELTHAQQYELMTCLDGGLEELNYIYAEHITDPIRTYDKRMLLIIPTMAEELRNDKTNKYSDIEVPNSYTNVRDYILAADAVMRKDKKSVPMLLDAKHYQAVKDKKGKLSAEEEKRAKEYLEAYRTYDIKPSLGIFNRLTDDYGNNILEVEARKAAKEKN